MSNLYSLQELENNTLGVAVNIWGQELHQCQDIFLGARPT
jgi:hypothetical protein